MKFFLKYFSHVIFAIALAYYGVLAFLIETNPMTNKMIMVIIGGFWILWIFAKSFVKILAAIALLLTMCFAGYYIMHADEIECKKSGKEWNEKLQICEEKKTTGEKIKNAVTNIIKDTVHKLKDGKSSEKPEVQKENTEDETKHSKEETSPAADTSSVKEKIKDSIKEKIKDKIINKVKNQNVEEIKEEQISEDETVPFQEVIKEMIKETLKETIEDTTTPTENESETQPEQQSK